MRCICGIHIGRYLICFIHSQAKLHQHWKYRQVAHVNLSKYDIKSGLISLTRILKPIFLLIVAGQNATAHFPKSFAKKNVVLF